MLFTHVVPFEWPVKKEFSDRKWKDLVQVFDRTHNLNSHHGLQI